MPGSVTTNNFLSLTPEQFQSRMQQMHNEIVTLWSQIPGYDTYYVTCNCAYDCDCEDHNVIPRLRLSNCYYSAEFNILVIEQPFLEELGFKIFWSCVGYECDYEFACGVSQN